MKATASLILCLAGTIGSASEVRSSSSEAQPIVAHPGVPSDSPRLAPGDEAELTISVSTVHGVEPVHSGKLVIAADGKAEVPGLGRVQAAGLTPRNLSREIQRRLSEGRGQEIQPTVLISTSKPCGISMRSAAAAGRLKRATDSKPELFDAPGPQYRNLREEK